jgi:hypothetical protein
MASFTTSPSTWTNSSDANFRSWGSYIAARFLAVGMVQTADTGQINWTTVTAPLAVSTYQGYEIWRFADALQATAPVYFKIEYGSTTTSANNPGIRVTFGTGSDGAGNLSGSLSTAFTAGVGAYATPGSLFGSGSTNRFILVTYNGATEGMRFGFERTVDASGNVTSEGVFWISRPSVTTAQNQLGFWNRSTGMVGPAAGTANQFAALFPATTGITGVQTIVSPVFPEKGVFGNPILNLVGYLTSDIAENSTPTVYMYGTAHVYYCIPQNNGPTAAQWRGATAGSANEAMAIRYE